MENKLLELSKRPGFEGLQDLANTLAKIGEKKRRFGGKVVLPNLYLSTMEGYDIEILLEALEETLLQEKLFFFPGSVRHYCLSLDYARPETPDFPAFKSLFSALEDELSRFGSPFQGILVVDITDWVAKNACTETKFLDFLRYMAEVDERTLAIYLERTGNETKVETARRSLITKTRLEGLELKLKSPQIALKILKNELADLGFKLAEGLDEKMVETLEKVLATEGQEGPWTVRQLAEDIVYAAFKTGDSLERVLTEDILAPFLVGGSWLSDFTTKKRFYMGLIGD